MSDIVKNKKRRLKISLIVTLSIIALIIIGCGIYLGDYYRADMDSINAFSSMTGIEYIALDDGSIALGDEKASTGFIFYPGGKVEHTAYIPLMASISSRGILCIIAKMPFNLAVFDINAANGLMADFPQITEWYIGGHSLGGSMACPYLASSIDKFKGLILLGSYSTVDLSDTGVDVLSVYGSQDRVLNREKYEECKKNLPPDFSEKVIEGGCHAYFGMYGEQDGDGVASITQSEQIKITAEVILEMINK